MLWVTHSSHPGEAVLLSSYNVNFLREIRNNIYLDAPLSLAMTRQQMAKSDLTIQITVFALNIWTEKPQQTV